MKVLEDSGGKVTLHEVACCSHFIPGEVSEEPPSILRLGFSWNITNHLPGWTETRYGNTVKNTLPI